jgi:hypothetical protein
MGDTSTDLWYEDIKHDDILDMLEHLKESRVDPWTDDFETKLGIDILPKVIQIKESVFS